jgi:fucose permease
MKNNKLLILLPIFFGYFVMGFVDIVGISTNNVMHDFKLSNTLADLLPMFVFFWFLVLSVPVGLMMNKIGRKNSVIISMVITTLALLIPSIHYSFSITLLAFALLGIGNAILQVALNPLVTNVVSSERIPSSFTLGQFIKAIASFTGPIIAAFVANHFGNWKLIFPAYALVSIISAIWLASVPIEREKSVNKTISFGQCFGLLKNSYILMLFLGILLVVLIDVGLNTYVPQYLKFRCNLTTQKAGFGSSLYFLAKTIGAFAGTFILMKVSIKLVFRISVSIAILAFAVMLFLSGLWSILTTIFIVGFSCANIFSMIFSLAIQKLPEKANEISGLMMMGVSGGALVLLMGFLTDKFGLMSGMLVLMACLLYLLFFSLTIKKKSEISNA